MNKTSISTLISLLEDNGCDVDSINEILSIKNTEERWSTLKSYIVKIDPILVDTKIAWNLYKETL